MIQYIVQAALHGEGELFLDAEHELREAGMKATASLRELAADGPWAELVVELLLEHVRGNEAFEQCLEFLEEVEREHAATVKQGPSPEWLGAKLFQEYGKRVALLLGVYLVKLRAIWPFWKTVGVILYLRRLDGQSSAEHFIEFMLTTESGHYQRMARQSLIEIGDANVIHSLEDRVAALNDVRSTLEEVQDEIKGNANQRA